MLQHVLFEDASVAELLAAVEARERLGASVDSLVNVQRLRTSEPPAAEAAAELHLLTAVGDRVSPQLGLQLEPLTAAQALERLVDGLFGLARFHVRHISVMNSCMSFDATEIFELLRTRFTTVQLPFVQRLFWTELICTFSDMFAAF